MIIKIIKYSKNPQIKRKSEAILQKSNENEKLLLNQNDRQNNQSQKQVNNQQNQIQRAESKFQLSNFYILLFGIPIFIIIRKFVLLIREKNKKSSITLQNARCIQILNQQLLNKQSEPHLKKYILETTLVIIGCIILYIYLKSAYFYQVQKMVIPYRSTQNQAVIKQQYHEEFEPQTTRMLEFNKNYRKMYGIQRNQMIQTPFIDAPLDQIGLVDFIQIDSKFDYLHLKNRKQFAYFKQTIEDTITFDLFTFEHNQSLQRPKQYMKYVEFNSSAFMDYQLQNMEAWSGGQKLNENLKTYLASYLVYNKTAKRVRQLQHYYYNKLYKIDSIQNEISICVISTGYQIYSKGKYQRFFESIQQQNYSNYHIVIVDDKSPDDSGRHFYEHLKATDFKLKNRVKIIKNHVNIGGLANMYIYVKKFCNENDIVVNIDSDDALIGFQVFNVLNSVYQDPNVWYVYTTYFSQLSPQQTPQLGLFSLPITVNISENRLAPEWNTSHMRTYRQHLMTQLPMEQLVQYLYDKKHQMFLPRFYTIAADRLIVYAHLELSGNQRIKFIQEPFYFYDQSGTSKPCYYQYEHLIQYRSRIKRIMKPLDSIGGDVDYYPDAPLPGRIIDKFKSNYDIYTKCMKIFYDKQDLS